MKKLLPILLSLFIFISPSIAGGKKIIWSCKDFILGEKNILWLVEWGENSYIKVFDEKITANYSIEGIEKRWDWKTKNSDYGYSIILNANGKAGYYDFNKSKGESTKASQVYRCNK